MGGSDRSQHCHGQAKIFESYSVSNPDLAEWIRDNLEFDQLILEFYDGKDPNLRLHCSYNLMENRKKCMTAMKVAGKVEYKEGIIR